MVRISGFRNLVAAKRRSSRLETGILTRMPDFCVSRGRFVPLSAMAVRHSASHRIVLGCETNFTRVVRKLLGGRLARGFLAKTGAFAGELAAFYLSKTARRRGDADGSRLS